ncbi:succinyl-diaminopimelate desuccinylase [Alphaproteobacteria bacterium]|nr:succinyl-diaminopimelate desuccinylase [Alphaproteobacteria bacterium]
MNDFYVNILNDLVSFKSISPNDDGAIDYCEQLLSNLGFECTKLCFDGVHNLYSKIGNFNKNLCFAGHIDVVPPLNGWSHDPFVLFEDEARFYGRGTNDMKGPFAACFAAVSEFLALERSLKFSISFLITSDEELMGENGTKKVVEFMKNKGERITGCILCESCSPKESGEYIKIGCRGSLNVDLESTSTQCHIVNSGKFGNHIHNFIEILNFFANYNFDYVNENFTKTNLEITSIDIGNSTRNIIPAAATAKLNIRFNDLWTFEKLENFIESKLYDCASASFQRFYDPFVCANERFIKFLSNSIEKTIGKTPDTGTAGGNSDAIFIRELADVVEIGSPIENAHIVDEYITKKDVIKLRKIYLGILIGFNCYL